jgi:PAS domain-containing protein
MSRPEQQMQPEKPVAASGGDISVPASLPAEAAASDAERRTGPRRVPTIARMDAGRAATPVDRSWLPRRWPLLPTTMLIAVAANIYLSRAVPPEGALALIGLAVFLTLARRKLRGLEEQLEGPHRAVIALASIGAPLVTFACAMHSWVKVGGLAYEGGAASLLVVGIVAAVYARRHPLMIFASQAAIWLPSVLLSFSPVGYFALIVGLGVSILATREQMAMDHGEELERLARERAQWRARDILADYEETGQGWFWETDRRSQLTYLSPPVAEALGHSADQLLGRSLKTLFDLAGEHDGERTLAFHLSARSAFQELAVRAAVITSCTIAVRIAHEQRHLA